MEYELISQSLNQHTVYHPGSGIWTNISISKPAHTVYHPGKCRNPQGQTTQTHTSTESHTYIDECAAAKHVITENKSESLIPFLNLVKIPPGSPADSIGKVKLQAKFHRVTAREGTKKKLHQKQSPSQHLMVIHTAAQDSQIQNHQTDRFLLPTLPYKVQTADQCTRGGGRCTSLCVCRGVWGEKKSRWQSFWPVLQVTVLRVIRGVDKGEPPLSLQPTIMC